MKKAKFLVSHFDAGVERFKAGETYPLDDETRRCIVRGSAEEVEVADEPDAAAEAEAKAKAKAEAEAAAKAEAEAKAQAEAKAAAEAEEKAKAEAAEKAKTEAAAAGAAAQGGKPKK